MTDLLKKLESEFDVEGICNLAENVEEIQNHEQCEIADKIRKMINDSLRKLEKIRKDAKQPFLDGGREVDKIAKGISDPVTKAREMIDKRLRDYNTKIEAERAEAVRLEQEAMAKAEAEAAADPAALPPDLAQVQVPAPTAAPISTRAAETLEIYDESQIPREFLVVDQVAVRKALKAGRDVPGAKMVRVQRLA